MQSLKLLCQQAIFVVGCQVDACPGTAGERMGTEHVHCSFPWLPGSTWQSSYTSSGLTVHRGAGAASIICRVRTHLHLPAGACLSSCKITETSSREALSLSVFSLSSKACETSGLRLGPGRLCETVERVERVLRCLLEAPPRRVMCMLCDLEGGAVIDAGLHHKSGLRPELRTALKKHGCSDQDTDEMDSIWKPAAVRELLGTTHSCVRARKEDRVRQPSLTERFEGSQQKSKSLSGFWLCAADCSASMAPTGTDRDRICICIVVVCTNACMPWHT